MTYDDAFDITMSWEGGGRLHRTPGDRGGWTKWGISQRSYPHLHIPDMTEEMAKDIYKSQYWRPSGAAFAPEELQWDLFDFAVNAGVQTSVRALQKSINLCREARGRGDFLHEDGIMGPKTRYAMDDEVPDRLKRVFRAYRTDHYMGLAETGSAKFIHGWLRRVEGGRNG